MSAPSLDDGVEAFLDAVADDGLPESVAFGSDLGTEFVRRRRDSRRARRSVIPVAEVVETQTDDGVPLRVYAPADANGAPMLVYLHGGGWTIGDLDMHDATCRLISTRTGSVVVNVGYRLAPEHPFPAPLDDGAEAVAWAFAHAHDWGVDEHRVVVGGTSAGANLAAAVAVRRRDEGALEQLAGMILLYPVLDARMQTPSYADKANGFFLTASEMRFFWDAYVQDDRDRTHPWLSPGLTTDLDGLPPAVVVTAEHDPLRDEGNAFSARMAEAGLLLAGYEARGQIHGFLTVFPDAPATQHALALIDLAMDTMLTQ